MEKVMLIEATVILVLNTDTSEELETQLHDLLADALRNTSHPTIERVLLLSTVEVDWNELRVLGLKQ